MAHGPILSNTVLIKEYGTVAKGVCCCCGRNSLYEVTYSDGPLLLCSWCDLHYSDRWMR